MSIDNDSDSDRRMALECAVHSAYTMYIQCVCIMYGAHSQYLLRVRNGAPARRPMACGVTETLPAKFQIVTEYRALGLSGIERHWCT